MTKTSSDADKGVERDWRKTLFLPKTDFPMKAGLPKLEPKMIERWRRIGLFDRLRADAKGRDTFILHDGPPYANGHLHIGHALNKILKDLVNRSQQMLGKDANYVPGWDCHGLPIEWKIEEQYRAKGKSKDEVPINEFRRECREFAEHWIEVQRAEFIRLGVEGDWRRPYTTMSFDAEAKIAGELMKFAMSGLLYRGSKPVMWSVVERTALAEAEIEYHEIQSDTIWVKFPVRSYSGPAMDVGEGKSIKIPEVLHNASLVIWTTTPWTIPGNRAISFSQDIDYGLYEVIDAPEDNWAPVGDKFVIADALASSFQEAARIDNLQRISDVPWEAIESLACDHPLKDLGYDFPVPLLDGEHVTADTGTGFVHTAPGHGREDFDIWVAKEARLRELGIDAAVPFTVDEAGFFTREAPGFDGGRVIDDVGKWGDANKRVIEALTDTGALIARGRLRHDYPHSWRSKKPIIFRATPQWFVPMEDDKGAEGLRGKALAAIDATRFYPAAGQNRLRGMIESRPDWVISRQRAWGVPICVFEHKTTGEVLPNAGFNGARALIERITKAFAEEGADAWFAEGAKERFLDGIVADPDEWEQVRDILDVWFDSGSTHAFVLEERDDLTWPADLYLEGSDQHRGWFHSSLLESCGTRGRAPYEAVLTHGFILDEKGDEKMSKSKGNALSPQEVTKQYGAEILRLWVASSDFSNDIRFGPQLLQANTDSYRKLRNTVRFMLGNLHHFDPALSVPVKEMPELERYVLHLARDLDVLVRRSYESFEFGRVFHSLFNFCTVDLSAFYFDIRKDALYCDPHDSLTRRACLTVLDMLHARLTAWLAPVLCFTCEEAWLSRFPGDEDSVHLRAFPETPDAWSDAALADRWRKLRQVRRAVTGALEIERKEKRIGSSLEAAPDVYIEDAELHEICATVDMADLCITSQLWLHLGAGQHSAFRHPDVPGVAVVSGLAEGRKCARSWKTLPEVGADPDYPDLSPRDAEAVRQYEAMTLAAQ